MFSKLNFFCLIWIGVFCWSCNQKSTSETENTVVYLVRHAEKDLNDTTDDPPLTPEGYARAEKLVNEFSDVQLDAIYSTRYQRNMNTVKPLAEKYGMTIQEYEAGDFEAIVNTILEEHTGDTVIVCGHSNTLLPLISQLGAEPPQDNIGDDEYDNIFKVVLGADASPQVSINKY